MGTVLTKITCLDTSDDPMLVDGSQSTVPHMDDVQDFQMDSSDNVTSSNAQYGLLTDGSRRIGGGNRGDNALINHEGKSRCLATVHENKLEQERRAAAVAEAISTFTPFAIMKGRQTHSWTSVLASRWHGQMIHWLSSRSTCGLVMQLRTTIWVSSFQQRITMAKRLLDLIYARLLIENLRQLSQQPPGRLNYQYQTHNQLTQSHQAKNQITQTLKLTNINLSRNLTVAKKHLDIDDRFVSAILSNKSSRVDQLMCIYTSQGASRSAITEAIQKASASLLKVRSYTKQEIDMATVLFRTGGRKLVYAANHGLGLPSVNTIRAKAQVTHLLPSLGLPTPYELWHNITILIDEIALEERPVFIKWLNSVGGLCREHTKGMNLCITNDPGLRTLAEALFQGPEPTIHFVKEATVAGITAFRADSYEVRPIFAAGTCKKETAPSCVELIQTLLNAWKECLDGEKRHGPIWSVASDGDGVRRAAFHLLFMKVLLNPGTHFLLYYRRWSD
ncbi:hypothetical protein PILCRDRAFT_8649 [Piloderma croceum F 1598]|uniref:Uncharacterized protein n=1 Tax=Piloderma croceum (strain F 1598) TaxID=765440 RepID=A0A0C3B5X2_PILCF|nr:hypothetical protein PILCRDRAFT_8649 [Piloderma croceum F 1598]